MRPGFAALVWKGPRVAADFQSGSSRPRGDTGPVSVPPAPIRGEVIKLNDRQVLSPPGRPRLFRAEKEGRPYLVLRREGFRLRVMPQSTEGGHGVFVPEDTLAGMEAGWFVPWSGLVTLADAIAASSLGHLPERYIVEATRRWKEGPG
jgi:hypothetical protein